MIDVKKESLLVSLVIYAIQGDPEDKYITNSNQP